jgi:hypothetical protein
VEGDSVFSARNIFRDKEEGKGRRDAQPSDDKKRGERQQQQPLLGLPWVKCFLVLRPGCRDLMCRLVLYLC